MDTQTPEEVFLTSFRPDEVAALHGAVMETCIVCGQQFKIDLDNYTRGVCETCQRNLKA
jgi:hypothetical protein